MQHETEQGLTFFFDEYTAWTDRVAQYPITAEPFYLALGIANELGELVQQLMHSGEGLTEWRANVRKEAGDVCWYLARYGFRVLNHTTRSVIDAAMLAYEEQPAATDLQDVMKAVGEITGVEKKRIRDGSGWNQETEERYNERAHKAVQVIWGYLSQTLDVAGKCGLVEVMRENQAKLSQRLASNTIKGEGDHR